MSEIKSFGLVPFKDGISGKDFSLDYCGNNSKHKLIQTCSQKLIDEKALKDEFDKDCKGKKSC